METVLFSDEANIVTHTFVVAKGEGELEMFVVAGRNLNDDIYLMNMKATVKAVTI
jgi:hypothetical protein